MNIVVAFFLRVDKNLFLNLMQGFLINMFEYLFIINNIQDHLYIFLLSFFLRSMS